MSPADRNKQRHLLGFEHFETKISPTASFWDMVWVQALPAVQVTAQQQVSTRFLEYVETMLEDIQIERDFPIQSDASYADLILAAKNPM